MPSWGMFAASVSNQFLPLHEAKAEGPPHPGSAQHLFSLLWWQTGLPASLGPMKQFMALEEPTSLKSARCLVKRTKRNWLFGDLGFTHVSTIVFI